MKLKTYNNLSGSYPFSNFIIHRNGAGDIQYAQSYTKYLNSGNDIFEFRISKIIDTYKSSAQGFKTDLIYYATALNIMHIPSYNIPLTATAVFMKLSFSLTPILELSYSELSPASLNSQYIIQFSHPLTIESLINNNFLEPVPNSTRSWTNPLTTN